MIKLLLTLVMMFTFGTSTVNAAENTTNIEDRISELAEVKSDNQSIINARVDELSEDELKAIIANVDELTETAEEDLAIKEAATNKLEEMKRIEALNPLRLGVVAIGLYLFCSLWEMLFKGYSDESIFPFIVAILLLMVLNL